ncbi:hypothetical protein [Robertmurraya kyonggiensis]|uniref:Uncharacterized protein n=1 Tax=Robertmurraya kyonggiensis TaxID=1037680 RepID=A0A4V5P244_9BACI|nr:hypothetical protein [Robertmurraya kyonggiensis]TKC18740.1 hypothetical protein FA727_04065 [Robertmurraya kyonggiensis]
MVLLAVLPFFIGLILIAFIIIAAVKNKEGGEKMIRHLYTYLVLFATLMMVIGGGISIFMATADLVSPPAYYQSYSDFKMMKESEKISQDDKNTLSEDELRTQYDQLIEDEEQRQKNNAVNQIIKSLGFIVIPLPIFIYFNRLRKKIIET